MGRNIHDKSHKMITNIYRKEIKMKKNTNDVIIKSSWAYWGVTSVVLLTTVAIIVSFVVDMIETQSFVWDYLYYVFWPLVIDAIFIEFSTRRLVINTEKRH